MKNTDLSQKPSSNRRYFVIFLGVLIIFILARAFIFQDGGDGPSQGEAPSVGPQVEETVPAESGDASQTPMPSPVNETPSATSVPTEINLGEGQCSYYSASSGNQDGTGSFTNPFQTIQSGVEILLAGDVLCIREGTYNEIVTVSNSGSPTEPITIQAYPGESPMIDGRAGVDCVNCGLPEGAIVGTDPVSGKGFVYEALLSIAGDYAHIEGLTISRSLGRCIQVWREDHTVTGTVIRDNNIRDCRNEAILLENMPDQTTIENNDISLAGSFATYSRDSSALDWPGALSVISGTNTIVQGNVIHENWTEGAIIGRRSSHTIFQDNILYDNYALQLYIHAAEDAMVQGNLIYHTRNPEFFRGKRPSDCIVIASAEPQFNSANVDKVRVVNNIVAGCSTNIAFWSGTGQIHDVIIAHNTVVNAYDPMGVPVGIEVGNTGRESMADVRIANNIVLQGNGDMVIENGQNGVVYENNLWSRDEIPARATSSGDVIGNPQLAKPHATLERGTVIPDWYKLTPQSPAIARASVLSEVNTDFFGTIRDSQPDIGANEYAGP